MTTKRYPCSDPGCVGCQDDPSGASCDHAAGRVRPPGIHDRPHTHERAGTAARVPWSELPSVRKAVGE